MRLLYTGRAENFHVALYDYKKKINDKKQKILRNEKLDFEIEKNCLAFKMTFLKGGISGSSFSFKYSPHKVELQDTSK